METKPRLLHREVRSRVERVDLVRTDDVGFIPAHHSTGYIGTLGGKFRPTECDEPDTVVTIRGMESLDQFLARVRRVTHEDEVRIADLETEILGLRQQIRQIESEAWKHGTPITTDEVMMLAGQRRK